MATVERHAFGNHEVANQPPPLVDYNVFEADRPLGEAVRREGAEWAEERIARGRRDRRQRADAQELGRLANENPPKLRTHDRYGNRVDEVEFHPAWHELMEQRESPTSCTARPGRTRAPAPTSARGAAFICMSQAEAGIGCPISMTYSVDPGAAHAARAGGRVGAAPVLRRPTTGATRRRRRRPGRWPGWG